MFKLLFLSLVFSFSAYADSVHCQGGVATSPVQCGNGNTTNTYACRNATGQFGGVMCGSRDNGPMGIAACCAGVYNPANFSESREATTQKSKY